MALADAAMSVSGCFFCPEESRKRSRHRKFKNSNIWYLQNA